MGKQIERTVSAERVEDLIAVHPPVQSPVVEEAILPLY